MLSNHKLQVILEEIKEISRVDLSLYSDKGKLLTSTCEIEDNMEGAIQLFAESMAESQMLSGIYPSCPCQRGRGIYDWPSCRVPDTEHGRSLSGAV